MFVCGQGYSYSFIGIHLHAPNKGRGAGEMEDVLAVEDPGCDGVELTGKVENFEGTLAEACSSACQVDDFSATADQEVA